MGALSEISALGKACFQALAAGTRPENIQSAGFASFWSSRQRLTSRSNLQRRTRATLPSPAHRWRLFLAGSAPCVLLLVYHPPRGRVGPVIEALVPVHHPIIVRLGSPFR